MVGDIFCKRNVPILNDPFVIFDGDDDDDDDVLPLIWLFVLLLSIVDGIVNNLRSTKRCAISWNNWLTLFNCNADVSINISKLWFCANCSPTFVGISDSLSHLLPTKTCKTFVPPSSDAKIKFYDYDY